MSYKGYFKPKNPQKYKGNPSTIIYRSLWELRLMGYLDNHPDVIQWSSEEFSIPYRSPIDNRIHRYFPDFWVKQRNTQNVVETLVIEIKPHKQTIPPVKQQKRTRTYLKEVRTWGVNSAKWAAAEDYCKDRKWKFVIFDEYKLGIKNG
jgi:hypothetical protein